MEAKPDLLARVVRQDEALEARSLPAEGPIALDVRRAIQDRFAAYTREQGLSLADVAAEVRYSAGVLSEWTHDRYTGKVEAVTRAVDAWLERRGRQDQAALPGGYVETWVAQEMKAAAQLAIDLVKIAALTAPSGSGKDMVVRVLVERTRGLYVYAHGRLTPRGLEVELAQQLGLSAADCRASDVGSRVIAALVQRQCPIFINEAHQLRQSCAGVVRRIYDNARVPVLLFGSREVFRWIDDTGEHGDGQFARRCLKFNIASRLGKAEDPERPGHARSRLFTVDEVRRVLEARKLTFRPDVVALLADIACLPDHGSLGLVIELCRAVLRLWPAEQVTPDMVRQALPLLLDAEAAGIESALVLQADADRAMARKAG